MINQAFQQKILFLVIEVCGYDKLTLEEKTLKIILLKPID